MLGGHLLAASATTQDVVATSSGEAEPHALTKSASRALGAVAMAVDMAKVVKPRVRVDATASKAIASRRGVGRVSHLQTGAIGPLVHPPDEAPAGLSFVQPASECD